MKINSLITTLACSIILLANFAAFSQPIEKGCFYIQPSGYYRYFSIVQTYDGNYVIGGLEYGFASALDQNFWIIKIDAAANILWSSSLGTQYQDGCFRLIETADHKILAAGWVGGSGDQDFFIVKYDEDGTIIWKKNIDHATGAGSDVGYFRSVIESPDGGYVLAGAIAGSLPTYQDAYLLKVDVDGNKEWSTKLNDGAPYGEIAESVVASSAGGYLVSGWGTASGCFFSHVDEDGVIQWSLTYADPAIAFDDIAMDDGGYLISGYELGAGQPKWNAFVTRIDSSGNKVWSKTYGGDGSEAFYGLYPTSDGGFIGAGTADTGAYFSFASERGFVVKCNSAGEAEWSKKVNSATLIEDVIQTADGGYALLGNGSVIKLDSNGNACDQCLLEDFGSWEEAGNVTPYTMNNYVADDSIFNPTYTLYTGGTRHIMCDAGVGINEIPTEEFQVYPNPCDKYLTVIMPDNFSAEHIFIADVDGKIIYKNSVSSGLEFTIDASSFPNGIYLVQLAGEKKTTSGKLVVVH